MFELPKLPFPYDALEPHLDALTMKIHHTKHHQTYVDKLNDALKNETNLQIKSIEDLLINWQDLPSGVQTAVRNHGGGHANHSLFWSILSPTVPPPTAQIKSAIVTKFGSIDNFQTELTTAAAGHFGSGWGWLVVTPDQQLQILTTPNQDSPLMQGLRPVLGIDVWEHAYYLKYQNRRPEYLQAFWQVINWPEVERRYLAAINQILSK